MVVPKLKPTALPPSICPGSTERIPLRMISDMYAPLFKPNTSMETCTPVIRIPIRGSIT